MKVNPLNASEREFLSHVSAAAFANPFGDDRAQAESKITGLSPKSDPDQRLNKTLATIRAFLAQLKADGRSRIDGLPEPDREPLFTAHLFDVFHVFMARFDQLIEEQVRTRDTTAPVPFATDVVQRLSETGCPRAEVLRTIGMFYQLRRAYFFIAGALAGRSPSMKQLRRALWNNVFTHDMKLYEQHLWNRMEDFSTLLLGETGTGKGAAAAAIGRSGFIPFDQKKGRFTENFTQAFLPINLSQFPESLIESELFGHRKGAFTGAVEAHQGAFSRCSPHGAIFLDEIGDVSVPVQIKLLQVLQDRAFSPVGSHETQRFHGRVIAATNRPLEKLRRERVFRDDFFYRLSSDTIAMPTLRQRIEEDPAELDVMLDLTVRRIVGQTAPRLVDIAREAIRRDLGKGYAWPGNVRELEQSVRRILLTRSCQGDAAAATRDLQGTLLAGIKAGTLSARDLMAGYCRLLHARHGTYEEVSKRLELDRRTVRRYITENTGAPPDTPPA